MEREGGRKKLKKYEFCKLKALFDSNILNFLGEFKILMGVFKTNLQNYLFAIDFRLCYNTCKEVI